MDRRKMLGMLGGLGAGLTWTGAATADHGADAPANAKFTGAMAGPHLHFCGIHIAKNNPKIQLVTQHYCAAHAGKGDDQLFQCVLFDSHEKNAKLLGVEYLISDKMYRALPEAEKKYWHVHTYEVLAGGLVAPGMDPKQEMEFMKVVLTTWGKTWHTWPDPSTNVPIGDPLLMWSVTGDGQLDDKVVAERDRKYNVSTAKLRELRVKEIGLEVPQVDLPTSIDAVGRQWTNSGDDKPTKRK